MMLNEYEALLGDDFQVWRSGDYTSTDDGGTGTVSVLGSAGARGGWLVNPTAAAANDYHLLSSVAKIVEFAAGKPFSLEFRMRCTESGANLAHLVFGVSDTLTTGFMADNTGEPPASWDGSVIYKPAGAAVWKHKTSNAAAATTTANIGTFVSGNIFTLGLVFDPADGVTGTIQPYINGLDSKTDFTKLAKHNVSLTSMGPSHVIFGVKASAAAVETLHLDYWRLKATR